MKQVRRFALGAIISGMETRAASSSSAIKRDIINNVAAKMKMSDKFKAGAAALFATTLGLAKAKTATIMVGNTNSSSGTTCTTRKGSLLTSCSLIGGGGGAAASSSSSKSSQIKVSPLVVFRGLARFRFELAWV